MICFYVPGGTFCRSELRDKAAISTTLHVPNSKTCELTILEYFFGIGETWTDTVSLGEGLDNACGFLFLFFFALAMLPSLLEISAAQGSM